MLSRILFFIKYGAFWLLYFFLFRFLFLIYQFHQTMELSFGEWIGLSVRGVWMDLSLTGYILGVVGLLLSILFFAGEKVLRKIFSYFSLVLLILFTGILVADLELYRNWGFRIDGTPLLYLKTPGEAMASVKVWLMVLLLLLAGSVVFISYKLLLKFAFSKKYQIEQGKWWMVPILLFLTATMIIPVRGGFGIAPMNPGKVYFSQNIFANHAALNGIWNLMYGLSKSADMYRQYPNRVSTEEAQVWRSAKFESQGNSHKILKSEKPNVVIILLESFGSKLIEPLGGMAGVTPNFNRLTREGLLFTNIFASGDRSDKGIVSVLSGFPAQSTQSIIKFPLKSAKLSTISEAFDSIGYSTTFYYGGDPDFANIRSYLYSAKFRKLVTQDDFPKSYRNSKWGVHDEHVFTRLLTDLDSAKAPFFKFFFTLSSHEPFEIPTSQKFSNRTEEEQYFSSVFYADSCLGRFFDEAKTRDWYDSTLFILVADHGHRLPGNNPIYSYEKFRIPMLWIGGVVDTTGRVEKTASQFDLAVTLLSQLNIDTRRYPFSRNIFSARNNFACYVFNDGFGYVTDSTRFVWDHVGVKPVESADSSTVEDAFSFFRLYQDYFLGL